MSFKAGDRVKMIANCGNLTKGEHFTVEVYGSIGTLRVKNPSGDACTCQNKWELLHRDLDHLEVDDLLKAEDGSFRRVLGVCGKAIFTTWSWENEEDGEEGCTTCSVQELKDDGWSLVTEDKEEESVDKKLEDILYRVANPSHNLSISEAISEIKKALGK